MTGFLRYEAKRALARILAAIELHHLQTINVGHGQRLWKRRRIAAELAIRASNLFLRMQQANVEILTVEKWLRWELVVSLARHENDLNNHQAADQTPFQPMIRDQGLVASRTPGKSLRDILASKRQSLESKLQCVGWALGSLERMHSVMADWGEGTFQPISHGDATAENVIIDEERQAAGWIDFDTRHLPRLSPLERHADDLRALMFSSAIHFTRMQHPLFAAQLLASYQRRETVEHFLSRLASDWRRPNVFQLAQAPLSFADFGALLEALLKL